MKKLYHIGNALAPVANAFAGTVYTDIFNMKDNEHVSFIIQKGIGAVGTSTITIEACDDVAGTNVVAIPFNYQACVSGDTFGAMTKVAATGFVTTAGSNQMYKIEADVDLLGASGYSYVRLKAVEVVAAAVTGGILAIFNEQKFEQEIPGTTIV